uniref:Uncharacterized protein n=1 Tax=Entomoneis paludosa TaxID=265537 RepID=A0A7S2YS48_9STRA
MVRHIPGNQNTSMYIPLNAATSVEITGDRYLHGWIQHRFESMGNPSYNVVARARQFSSFLMVIGNMAGKDKLSPKHAIILQNKDEVLIPLLNEVLPTAKEFKDAISSLSPEQQAFAKAYRGMQLESSVFGVCIIQLKPQLEKLLGLPSGALTKEIQLTQDLMSLFVDYQIPSDLLSYDGDAASNMAAKLETVKAHVKAVVDVVDAAKEKELLEEERKKEMREAQSAIPSPPSGGMFGAPSPQYAAAAFKTRRDLSSAAPRAGGGGGSGLFGGQINTVLPPLTNPPSLVALSDQTNEQEESQQTSPEEMEDGELVDTDDFTLIPKVLDGKIEKLDQDNSLRSTILKAGTGWSRRRQENLLTKAQSKPLASSAVEEEKNKAFDLLDALSRSGTLSIDCSELHVVVALSHCFENDVMGTVIQDNINPIEKVERSSIIVASTIHDEPSQILLSGNSHVKRLGAAFPALFVDED